MKLTPIDIKKQEFKRSLRGYDCVEVDAFLETLSNQWEDLLGEKEQLGRRLKDAEMEVQKFKQVENMLHQTLAQAQQSSTAAVENAKREAELIKQEAQMHAENMLDQAKNESNLIREDIQRLLLQRHEIISKLKLLLGSQLELLQSLGKDSGAEMEQAAQKQDVHQKKIQSLESRIKKDTESFVAQAKQAKTPPSSKGIVQPTSTETAKVQPEGSAAPKPQPRATKTPAKPNPQERREEIQSIDESFFAELDSEENPDMVFQPVQPSKTTQSEATGQLSEIGNKYAPKTTRVEVPIEEPKKKPSAHRGLNIDDILDSLE